MLSGVEVGKGAKQGVCDYFGCKRAVYSCWFFNRLMASAISGSFFAAVGTDTISPVDNILISAICFPNTVVVESTAIALPWYSIILFQSM